MNKEGGVGAPLAFDQYVSALVHELGLSLKVVATEATGLHDELGLDSFSTFELIVVTEQLADVRLPPPEVPPLFTLGDAYAYYLYSLESTRDQPAVPTPSWAATW
ncbi:MAG: acyl carrier protein [Nitrospiraceae bacterium]|nr:acyl carrier protein [Nitrospiraceae bacterium]